METELDERFLQAPQIRTRTIFAGALSKLTFLCTFNFRKISVASNRCWFSNILNTVSQQLYGTIPETGIDALLRIERQKWQVQYNRKPVSVNDKQESQESMDGGFGDDVGVEAVAQVNRVDIITVFEVVSQHCSHCPHCTSTGFTALDRSTPPVETTFVHLI